MQTVHFSSAVDSSVINILGELSGDLYGIAWDKRSFMHSADSGQTWMAISYNKFALAKATAGYEEAWEVKWIRETAGNPLEVARANSHATLTRALYGGKSETKPISTM